MRRRILAIFEDIFAQVGSDHGLPWATRDRSPEEEFLELFLFRGSRLGKVILGKLLWKVFRPICITMLGYFLEEFLGICGESGGHLEGEALKDITLD